MTASFGTIASRIAEFGSGYLAGSEERDTEARAERMKLLTTGLQLGASGLDATRFLSPDMVSRDNQPWFESRFQLMGNEFTRPYRDAQERQVAAQKADRDFQIALTEYKERGADNRARIAANTTLGAAAIRAGASGKGDLTPLDELRLEDAMDTLIARQFGQIVGSMQDDRGAPIQPYGADGKINPALAPALAQYQDMIRNYVGSPSSLAEMRQRIVEATNTIKPSFQRTDSSINPLSSPGYKMSVPDTSRQALAQQALQIALQRMYQITSPSERAAQRVLILNEIERRFGADVRAYADKQLAK